MEDKQDFSKDINQKLEEIHNKVKTGEIFLLDIELVPIFENLINSLNTRNLNKYSKSYKSAIELLQRKFEELKSLINYLDRKEGFFNFIKSNPSDSEYYQLFEDCWIKPFNIESLSLEVLESSHEKLSIERDYPSLITHLDKIKIKQKFLLEVPEQKFTEKMLSFYSLITPKLPCSFDEIFEHEKDQIKIYENFVYVLHLLQLGKLKYQKETNYLYI
ncbi:MAG: hypothetical protein ACFFBI_00135 [Promethearchaeota archaeon]